MEHDEEGAELEAHATSLRLSVGYDVITKLSHTLDDRPNDF